ncbi:MAG: proteasome assembly chaperone family protein [Candidatus Aenigmatarchaeota archaeon]
METELKIIEEPDLENPVLVEGLPGIGNVGRIAAEYLIKHLDAKKFAELYSPYFMPIVLIHDDEISLLKFKFYYWKNSDGNDIIFLIGDTQAGKDGSKGHFEIAKKVIDFAEEMGVERIITLGGYGTGDLEDEVEGEPDVLGAVTNSRLVDEYEEYNINFEDTDSKIGMIVGGTGLLLGMAKKRGMEGLSIMSETAGFPLLTDPKSAESVVRALSDILEIEVPLDDIEEKVGEMEDFLKKLENVQKKAMEEMKGAGGAAEEEKLRYIG